MENTLESKLIKLKELFYDPKQGFTNANQLFNKAKFLGLKKREVDEFYSNQPINQVMKPVSKPKGYNSYDGFRPNYKYQMDIIVYDRYKEKGYTNILVVVDIYSRYAEAEPLKGRTQSETIEAFKRIIKRMGPSEEIKCDNEFNRKDFIKVFEDYNIRPYFSNPNEQHKNPIVERLNRTIASKIQKIRISLKRKDWYNYLPDIMYNYNNTIHSTTKDTPTNIFRNGIVSLQQINRVSSQLEPNDKVRIVLNQKTFSKGDTIKYSPEIHIIESINRNWIKLIGVDKKYKTYQLIKISHLTDTNDSIESPETHTQENQLAHLYSRLSISDSNIIKSKRVSKQTKMYDV